MYAVRNLFTSHVAVTWKAKWPSVTVLLRPLAAHMLSVMSAISTASSERCLRLLCHVSHTRQQ